MIKFDSLKHIEKSDLFERKFIMVNLLEQMILFHSKTRNAAKVYLQANFLTDEEWSYVGEILTDAGYSFFISSVGKITVDLIPKDLVMLDEVNRNPPPYRQPL